MQYHYVVIWDTVEEKFLLDWDTTVVHFEDKEVWDGEWWTGLHEFPAIETDYYLTSDKLATLVGGSC